MRLFRISLSLWYDPNWRACFRLSWRRRRYWLAMPRARTTKGRALALQTGPLTFKLHTEGRITDG